MGTPLCFSTLFTKGNIFLNFWFISQNDDPYPKKAQLLKERANSFLLGQSLLRVEAKMIMIKLPPLKVYPFTLRQKILCEVGKFTSTLGKKLSYTKSAKI